MEHLTIHLFLIIFCKVIACISLRWTQKRLWCSWVLSKSLFGECRGAREIGFNLRLAVFRTANVGLEKKAKVKIMRTHDGNRQKRNAVIALFREPWGTKTMQVTLYILLWEKKPLKKTFFLFVCFLFLNTIAF